MPTTNTGVGSASAADGRAANQSASNTARIRFISASDSSTCLVAASLNGRLALLVVCECALMLSPIVVDLAERQVQIALRVLVRGAALGRGTDAVLVLVVLRGEPLRFRQIERGLGESRIERQRRAIVLARGVEIADRGMDDAGIVVNFGGVRLDLDRLTGLCHRFVLPAQLGQGTGESRADLRVVRRERSRLSKGVFRTGQIIHVQQRMSQVEICGGVARVVGESGLVAGDRLLPPIPLLKQVSEAVVGDGDGWMAAEQAAVQIDGEVGAAALARDGSKEVQRIGLIGDRVEHPPRELLRLAQIPGAVRVEGASQPSIEAGIGAGLPRAERWSALLPSSHAGIRRVLGAGRRMPAASERDRPRPWRPWRRTVRSPA